MTCRHDEWEVSRRGSDVAFTWHSPYPPPSPGTRILLSDGDIPVDAHKPNDHWIVVEVTWWVGFCIECEHTIITPCVVIAPEGLKETPPC